MLARSRLALLAAPAVCAVLLTGCAQSAAPSATAGSAASASAPAGAASAPAGAASADATTLALAMSDSSLGSILVDGKGMTLYLFTKDSPNTSACTDQCLIAWPPLLGKPTAGSGVDGSKLGSFQRADGTTQATYNGWPLYYWKADAQPGDVLGQNVNQVWFVLDRDGNPVKK